MKEIIKTMVNSGYTAKETMNEIETYINDQIEEKKRKDAIDDYTDILTGSTIENAEINIVNGKIVINKIVIVGMDGKRYGINVYVNDKPLTVAKRGVIMFKDIVVE